MKKLLSLIILLLSVTFAIAQDNDKVEMADAMRSNGGIYVVVATLAIIFIGLAIYLFMIDKRLKKVENEK